VIKKQDIISFMNKDFKRGFESVLFFQTKSNLRERIPNLSTEERIRRNWEAVGNDIKKSIDTFNYKNVS
jgi:hypothetical protein